MEIGNRNPYIMRQYAVGEAVYPDRRREDTAFDKVLENSEKAAGPKRTGQKPEGGSAEEEVDYRKLLLEKMEEMRANIRNGTIQPKIQIGAAAYTQEEWKKLLEKVDAAEEAVREQLEAEIAAAKEKAKEKEEAGDEDDGATRIITRPDGAKILMIKTSFGEMSVELSGPDDSNVFADTVRECGIIFSETVDNAAVPVLQ